MKKTDIEECYEKTGKAPIRVRWLDINKGDEKNRSTEADWRPKKYRGTTEKICLQQLLF